jgi:hypothetical protein
LLGEQRLTTGAVNWLEAESRGAGCALASWPQAGSSTHDPEIRLMFVSERHAREKSITRLKGKWKKNITPRGFSATFPPFSQFFVKSVK